MLAELAIANAAFAIIKTTLANGKDIADAGSALGKYFGAEKAIAKAAVSGKGNVLEAFQAKEQLSKIEEDLRYMLNKSRINGYSDFVQFKVQYTRDLREAEQEAARKRYAKQEAFEENLAVGIKAGLIILVVMAALFGVALYMRT